MIRKELEQEINLILYILHASHPTKNYDQKSEIFVTWTDL